MLKVMKDMMGVVREKKGQHVDEIYNDTEMPLLEEAKNIKFIPCPNPRCDCGTLYALLEPDNSEKMMLPINVHEERLLTTEECPLPIPDHELQKRMEEAFLRDADDEMWARLTVVYLERKNIIIDEVNPDKITVEFDEEDILDEGLMVHFQDIFPCAHFPLTLGQSVYVITDSYCKNDLCRCNDMMFNIGKVCRDEQEFLGYYEYNYGFQQGNFSDVEAENKLIAEKVIDALFLEYPDLDKTVRKRNTIVRKLFKKSKKEYWKSKGRTSKNASPVSRNAPCPCGSGKKYKRCCGRN